MRKVELLDLPLLATGLSAGFCESGRQMGFTTLRDIATTSPHHLVGRKGFSYHWLAELTTFLQQNELTHLLQSIPGNIPG